MPVNEGWSPSLETGIREIDEQHHRVFGAIDSLLNALRHGYAHQEIEFTLKDLQTYASEHFRQEETLMREKGYPGLRDHAHAHAAFTERLNELRKMLQDSGSSKALAVQTLQAIGKLLMQDIETHDRKLAAFLRDQVKAP